MKNKQPKPSVKKVEIECEICGNEGHIYFTNQEIWSNTLIKQQCKVCDKITIWRLK